MADNTNQSYENFFFTISNISLLSSNINNQVDIKQLFDNGFFSDKSKFDEFIANKSMGTIANYVTSPLKKRMSNLSIGICASLEQGVKQTLTEQEQMYLLTSFAEIETTNKIISSIITDKSLLVSPTLFHNSVHNTPLGYFTVINKLHNYCVTISDGLDTNKSFVEFLNLRLQCPNSFIIASGEENSNFYALDTTKHYEIMPIFISFRITPQTNNGYRLFTKTTINEIDLSKYDYIFADFNTFTQLNTSKNIFTEYAITRDNPSALAIRLALPDLLNLSGKILIIDKNNDYYTFFEVEK